MALAGGAGNLVAGLICGETLPVDITRLEVTRFISLHSSAQYLIERVPEVAGAIFSCLYVSRFCMQYYSEIDGRSRDRIEGK